MKTYKWNWANAYELATNSPECNIAMRPFWSFCVCLNPEYFQTEEISSTSANVYMMEIDLTSRVQTLSYPALWWFDSNECELLRDWNVMAEDKTY